MSDLLPHLTAALANRYRVERELGAGGMATVYLAHDEKHDREVAVKVLRPELAQTLGAERFLREIALAASLSHPHILPLFDSGEAEGQLFYVMPRVTGGTLRERLARDGPLPVADVERVAAEVADALGHAHRHGVVHRDIKPENILLHEGHALIADFGIGKALSAVEAEAFTMTGAAVGTPAYLSPEQAAGEAVDGRSDLFSLGCVLYEMLLGEPPFTGPTVQAVIAKRFVQTPADVTALRDGVPRPLARALQRLLARTPIDRYDTAAEFAAALRETVAPVGPAGDVPERSVAVLPFANLSTDAENEYFADGITEEILSALARVPSLRVAGRTSAFYFKGQKVPLREVAAQLKVRTILEGSVRRSGARVRITAQLLDAADGYQLWSERYDRELTDIFAVQDEIAGTIASRLDASLHSGGASAVPGAALPAATATAAAGHRVTAPNERATPSIAAYEAFLKGRALIERRGRAAIDGVACVERALALDPTFGPAWAALAEAYFTLSIYGLASPEEVRDKALPAAANAVRFAPSLAESYLVHGVVLLACDWERREAATEAFRRGMALDPVSPQSRWYYMIYLGQVGGHFARARDGLAALYARDERSASLCAGLAMYTAMVDPQDGLDWARRAQALDPHAFIVQAAALQAEFAAGAYPTALQRCETVLAQEGPQLLMRTWAATAAAALGDRARAVEQYEQAVLTSRRGELFPIGLALAARAAGLPDEAAGWARQAIERRDPGMFGLYNGRTWEALAGVPGWEALRTALRLPASVYLHDDVRS
jgi:TolB-like protein/tRNA A-37 threonylcarbamoyl transferase component Bud32